MKGILKSFPIFLTVACFLAVILLGGTAPKKSSVISADTTKARGHSKIIIIDGDTIIRKGQLSDEDLAWIKDLLSDDSAKKIISRRIIIINGDTVAFNDNFPLPKWKHYDFKFPQPFDFPHQFPNYDDNLRNYQQQMENLRRQMEDLRRQQMELMERMHRETEEYKRMNRNFKRDNTITL